MCQVLASCYSFTVSQRKVAMAVSKNLMDGLKKKKKQAKKPDVQKDGKRNPHGCQRDGKIAKATCSPRSQQLRQMLTSFTIPAPSKAQGGLGFLHSVLGRTRKGVFLYGTIRSLVFAGLHFCLHEGSYSLGPHASQGSKTKKAPPFRELPGCKKTTPGPPSGDPLCFVSRSR